ncbi:DUF4276 family protein [Dermacoccus nishinomiyaensis]
MTHFTFVLLREGSSDDGLVRVIRTLLLATGLTEVSGSPRPYGGTVREKLQLVHEEEGTIDAIFVHRDADCDSPTSRIKEITDAHESCTLSCDISVIPVIPIQELEAWLLADTQQIRNVAGKSAGRKDLRIPKPSKIEKLSNPKETLEAALQVASETSGRRLEKIKKSFGTHRRILLERLDVTGPVAELDSWKDLERRIQELAESRLADSHGER